MSRKALFTTILAVAVAACSSDKATGSGGAVAKVRILTATQSATALDLIVDGQPVITGVTYAHLSTFVNVKAGARTIGFRRAGAASAASERSVTLGADTNYTIVAIDSASVINPGVLTDTGAKPVAEKSKLRVVHFATAAPAIDVWRTQPDYGTLIRIMFPFPYRAASPYIMSDPGNWTVAVTPANLTSPQLYYSGTIAIPSGETRTVVLLDAAAGGVQGVILDK